ncbi:MAG: hypothetical protein ACRD1G_00185, partial [Acidimicrobiales bacterium]
MRTEQPRRKAYVSGAREDLRVPVTEVSLSPSPGRDGQMIENPAVLLYDTSGPGSDPARGLPPLRRPWID